MHVPDLLRDIRPQGAASAGPRERVAAWCPPVPGVVEVLHARFVRHVYPAHTHDTWTLLIVDSGAVRFDLGRHEYGAVVPRVTLLAPHVAHTGRAGTTAGFRKRVLYLDSSVLADALIGPAVASPTLTDPRLRQRISRLHDVLRRPEESLEAESRLALIASRIREHLRPTSVAPARHRRVADELRDLLDTRISIGLTLREASELLHAHPDHLVRAFTAAFGLPPHRYLTGRRVDAARHRLLGGEAPDDVAAAVGFFDQAHLTHHFTKQLGTTPARYARNRGSAA